MAAPQPLNNALAARPHARRSRGLRITAAVKDVVRMALTKS
jgi:hypothetical protein